MTDASATGKPAPTPETDAVAYKHASMTMGLDPSSGWTEVVKADFARNLELQRDEAKRMLIGEHDAHMQCHAERDALEAVLRDAQEELRLIGMKDTPSVYDPTLRVRIIAALSLVERKQQG